MATFVFYKYHGTGNDFVLVDNRNGGLPAENPELYALVCNRHFGVGADGLILLETDPVAVGGIRMRYYNADGRPGSMCGNGGRCFAQFALQLGLATADAPFVFTASDGPHTAHFRPGQLVALQMSEPSAVEETELGVYFVDTGSPHVVVWLTHQASAINSLDITNLAKPYRNAKRYAPGGTNVNWVEEEAAEVPQLRIRTFERGVEAETLSCGTGAVAAAIVARHREPNRWGSMIKLTPPGGDLWVEFPRKGALPWLVGPAVLVFKGEWAIN